MFNGTSIDVNSKISHKPPHSTSAQKLIMHDIGSWIQHGFRYYLKNPL